MNTERDVIEQLVQLNKTLATNLQLIAKELGSIKEVLYEVKKEVKSK